MRRVLSVGHRPFCALRRMAVISHMSTSAPILLSVDLGKNRNSWMPYAVACLDIPKSIRDMKQPLELECIKEEASPLKSTDVIARLYSGSQALEILLPQSPSYSLNLTDSHLWWWLVPHRHRLLDINSPIPVCIVGTGPRRNCPWLKLDETLFEKANSTAVTSQEKTSHIISMGFELLNEYQWRGWFAKWWAKDKAWKDWCVVALLAAGSLYLIPAVLVAIAFFIVAGIGGIIDMRRTNEAYYSGIFMLAIAIAWSIAVILPSMFIGLKWPMLILSKDR